MGIVVLGISVRAGVSSGVSDEVVIVVGGSGSEGVGSRVVVGAIIVGVADSAGIVSCVDSGVGAGVVSGVVGARVVVIGIEVVGSAVTMRIVVLGISAQVSVMKLLSSAVASVRASVQVMVWEPSSSVLPIVWASFQVLAQELRNLASLSVRVWVQGSVRE